MVGYRPNQCHCHHQLQQALRCSRPLSHQFHHPACIGDPASIETSDLKLPACIRDLASI